MKNDEMVFPMTTRIHAHFSHHVQCTFNYTQHTSHYMRLMKDDHIDEQLGGLIARKTIELICNLFGVLVNVTY
jgi:hypothetical protein